MSLFDNALKEQLRRHVPDRAWDVIRERFYRHLFSDRRLIEFQFRKRFGVKPDLINPVTYNEKLQWLKLHWRDPLGVVCADKFAVREHVRRVVGPEVINRIFGAYESANAIPWDELPSQCVFKATHGSGWNLLCHDRHELDRTATLQLLDRWLRRNHFWMNREWVYRDIPPRILIEEMLHDRDGRIPNDYKVFCFHGEPAFIQVDLDRFGDHRRNIYDLEWRLTPLSIEYPRDEQAVVPPPPLPEMLSLSRTLAAPFAHVRVDWFVIQDSLRFGEMTFFHGSGLERFSPVAWQHEFGRRISLSVPPPQAGILQAEPLKI